MKIFDIRIIEDISFDEYLRLPGLSYSAIKNGGTRTDPTDKMRFGSLVDAYLFEPQNYNGEQYHLVRPVAQAAIVKLGPLIKHGRRQLAVLCTMVYKGFYMYYKGRIDLEACNLIIDFKVSEMDVIRAINHFGYNHQLNGYAIPLGSKGGLIFSIHPRAPHNIQLQAIQNSLIWWQQQVLKHGRPI
jgi:hypothetical protein